MPDTPTPGQVAREAYWGVLGPQYHPCTPHDWAQLSPACQAAWEAAAQAVLEGCAMLCPICGAELERCNAKDTP